MTDTTAADDGKAEAREVAEAAAARGNKVAKQIVRQMDREQRRGKR
jgi:hypothetical protein